MTQNEKRANQIVKEFDGLFYRNEDHLKDDLKDRIEEALDFQSEYIRLLEAVVINAEQFAASVQEEEGFYPAVYNRQEVLKETLAALEEWRKKNAD